MHVSGTGDVLIIEVTNPREVVRQRIGSLGERLIGRVVDPEAQVEKALIQELETCLLYTSDAADE